MDGIPLWIVNHYIKMDPVPRNDEMDGLQRKIQWNIKWMISRGPPGTPIYGNHHIVYLCVSPNFMVYNWFIVVYKCLKSIALLELP